MASHYATQPRPALHYCAYLFNRTGPIGVSGDELNYQRDSNLSLHRSEEEKPPLNSEEVSARSPIRVYDRRHGELCRRTPKGRTPRRRRSTTATRNKVGKMSTLNPSRTPRRRRSATATDPRNTLATPLDTALQEQAGRVCNRSPQSPATGHIRVAESYDSRKLKEA